MHKSHGPVMLEPGLRRLRAPNPSPMTHTGTNTYLLGEAEIAVIDPGPDDPAHLEALLSAIGAAPVSHILVTHAHRDHSALAPALARATGAPVLGFGPPAAGRSPRMQALAEAGHAGGGEGLDQTFSPDARLPDAETVTGAGWHLTALHTPGHFAGHLCFVWQDRLFSGDHAMGWASTLISPPDGDVTQYMRSLERLQRLPLARMYPGHGEPVDAPQERLAWLRAHRTARRDAVRAALTRQPSSVQELTETIYADTPPGLLPAAFRNVFAHLVDLVDRNLAEAVPDVTPEAKYRRR